MHEWDHTDTETRFVVYLKVKVNWASFIFLWQPHCHSHVVSLHFSIRLLRTLCMASGAKDLQTEQGRQGQLYSNYIGPYYLHVSSGGFNVFFATQWVNGHQAPSTLWRHCSLSSPRQGSLLHGLCIPPADHEFLMGHMSFSKCFKCSVSQSPHL